MGSNRHLVKHESHTVEELVGFVADAEAETTEALQSGGEHSREHKNAIFAQRHYRRRLADAKLKEERHKKDSERTAREIVDKMMEP